MTLRFPQNYAWNPVSAPEGSLGQQLAGMLNGLEKNHRLTEASIKQIIAFLQALPTDPEPRLQSLERGTLPTYITDPGAPPVGQSFAFVLVDPGVSADFIIRNNDGGTVREAIIGLS